MSDGRHTSASIHAAALVLRALAAVAFGVQGYLAFTQDASLGQLLYDAIVKAAGVELADLQVELALRVIGAVDVICAGLVLVAPWRPLVAWMALWGFVTAAAPMVAGGAAAWTQTVGYLPIGGVPLALLCLWWRRADEDGGGETDGDDGGEEHAAERRR